MVKKLAVKYKFDRFQVWWEDATSHNEWMDLEETKKSTPSICFTEGFLLIKNSKWHTFFMSITGDEIGDVVIIPTKNIKRIKKIDTITLYKQDFEYDNH
jgi:hypothetical protein|tara:strand:- start:863 stop:1159 length:297 start_codon:yes stop_codon:yes gene_type:complete